jgi:hypothetical protein
LISRRAFVSGALALLAWPRPARAGRPAGSAPGLLRPDGSVAPALASALETSPYAYVSPLRSDGSESACHGEVWFAWLDGAVVTTTGPDRWKARALDRGLDRARIWVGDHGRWKQLGGRNEAFRKGPSFEARALRVGDAGLLERVLAVYETKYPEEIGRWRERMREEVASGKRVILRYVPLPSGG